MWLHSALGTRCFRCFKSEFFVIHHSSTIQTLPFWLSDVVGPFDYSAFDIGKVLVGSAIPQLIVSPGAALLSKKIRTSAN